MPHSLQQLRALIEAHPDRAPGLLRPVESLEAAVASEPELCLNRVRTLFEAVQVSIAPILGVQFAETSDFPARNSRIIKALDFSVPGHPEADRIGKTIEKLLGSINGTASALAELSNIPNLRHGGSVDWATLDRQHAVMLASLCDALVGFLFEVAWSRLPQPVPDIERYADFANFNTYLDEEYETVAIAGAAFEPSRVLFTLDPTQYDAARQEWEVDQAAEFGEPGLPEIREFERTSTAALNAVLQPVVGRCLATLETALERERFTGEFLIVQSNGGVMSVQTAQALPVRTALSGPAAGVIAAAAIAQAAGFPDIITDDVGGTSFDVSLVQAGTPALAAQSTIDFGLVIRTPMIEITTIGAGGGSIAAIDPAGLLQVGPQSAGSIPGPVCFGAGGTFPTLTDANVVLGRINADRPIGNTLTRLDVDAASRAIETHVGQKLGLPVHQAAAAILRVANARMAGALRLVSIERGHDPKSFSLMPFGGGGGLHAGALIADVGLARAVIPRFPGVTSALGCVIADMRHDRVRTPIRILNLRTTVTGQRPGIDLLSLAPAPDATLDKARTGTRTIWFGTPHQTPVWDRLALPVGATVTGPAMLEQPDTTILVEPGQHARVDRFGNLILKANA